MLIHSDPNNTTSSVCHLIIVRYSMETSHWYFPWATTLHLCNMTGRGEKLQQLHCYHPFSDSRDIYLTKNHYENYSPKMVPVAKIWGSGSWTNWTLGNKLQWNLNRNLNIFIQENAFENVVWEIVAIYLGLNVLKTTDLVCSGRATCPILLCEFRLLPITDTRGGAYDQIWTHGWCQWSHGCIWLFGGLWPSARSNWKKNLQWSIPGSMDGSNANLWTWVEHLKHGKPIYRNVRENDQRKIMRTLSNQWW